MWHGNFLECVQVWAYYDCIKHMTSQEKPPQTSLLSYKTQHDIMEVVAIDLEESFSIKWMSQKYSPFSQMDETTDVSNVEQVSFVQSVHYLWSSAGIKGRKQTELIQCHMSSMYFWSTAGLNWSVTKNWCEWSKATKLVFKAMHHTLYIITFMNNRVILVSLNL